MKNQMNRELRRKQPSAENPREEEQREIPTKANYIHLAKINNTQRVVLTKFQKRRYTYTIPCFKVIVLIMLYFCHCKGRRRVFVHSSRKHGSVWAHSMLWNDNIL